MGRRTHNGRVGPIPVDLEVEEATKPSHRQIQSQNKIKTATFFFKFIFVRNETQKTEKGPSHQ